MRIAGFEDVTQGKPLLTFGVSDYFSDTKAEKIRQSVLEPNLPCPQEGREH